MVAPLYVYVPLAHQCFNYAGRLRAAVKDVADDVQPVDGQALYERGERGDYIVGCAGGNYAVQYHVVIAVLVGLLVALDVQQFVEHEFPAGGHLAAHMSASVLAREGLGQQAEVLERVAELLIRELSALTQRAQLLARVVDDGAERAAALLAAPGLKQAADLFKYDAGAVVEDVAHGVVFAVQVADKMLRALGQREYGLEVYYLRADRRLVGVLLREQREIFKRKLAHCFSLLLCAAFYVGSAKLTARLYPLRWSTCGRRWAPKCCRSAHSSS